MDRIKLANTVEIYMAQNYGNSPALSDLAWAEILTALRAPAPEALPPQWIPVSELPEVNVPVVAMWDFKNTDSYECPYIIACYDGRIWHNPDDTDDDYSPPVRWMPLPSGPSVRKEG